MKWHLRSKTAKPAAESPLPGLTPGAIEVPLNADGFRWLHDKYERALQHEEGVLSSHLGFFYVLQGLIVSLLVGVVLIVHVFFEATFLIGVIAVLGTGSAGVGWAVTKRMAIACSFWRHCLWALESTAKWTGATVDAGIQWLTTPYQSFESVFTERRFTEEETLLVPTLSGPTVCTAAGIGWVVVFLLSVAVSFLGPSALSRFG